MDSKRFELADKNAFYESKTLNAQLCSFEDSVAEKMDSLGEDDACGGLLVSPKEKYVKILDFCEVRRDSPVYALF